ncbi:MAG TPA: patatin-like protein [Xanthobacteraceae bacterium]|nr:patatin-like protein [Xanthobacteraceae bacterium]
MREKELRIALVCFGGVSLAVYMHGLSKEILKLLRASSRLHGMRDRAARAKAAFDIADVDEADKRDKEYDTEAYYFELLREIGRKVELRVIVDTIAGASAGGINAVMLARAICHDLPMKKLRDLWLNNADVSVLLSPEAKAKAWSKFFLKPILWAASRFGWIKSIRDSEVRDKLSLFLRSRWFKPPLDGGGMTNLMYEAVTAMGAPKSPTASLLPSGQDLDLFVTLTDYHGYLQRLQIHDPPLIQELEHRQILHFHYRRRPGGEVESDFTLENAPALAFAARATSSFPGAFPPAQVAEIDELLARRGETWPEREEFFTRNFERHIRADLDPAKACFIDGAVLNNRPFREAISAIHGRPAYREVDRRLVYIDPDPAPPHSLRGKLVPGFFLTLKGALSDIPLSQPVTDELGFVFDFNAQVRSFKSIIEEARPRISELVTDTITAPLDQKIVHEEIRHWRETINSRVARDAGFAYEGYARLKLASVRQFVGGIILTLSGAPPRSPRARAIAEIIDAWAKSRGVVYQRSEHDALLRETSASSKLPRWAEFFLAFDVDYRKRRLNFLIEGQNRLYRLLDEGRFPGLDPLVVDGLKRAFYRLLDGLRQREEAKFYSVEAHGLVRELFEIEPSEAEAKDLAAFARRFVASAGEKIDRLIETLGREIDLAATTRDLDELLASLDPAAWKPEAWREVLVNYLGFPFWDVLTFSVATARDTGELHEILVDRISPQDIKTLKKFGGTKSLKGTGFAHFAAFLSRAYRENDYLLGRLHGIDRLIDIVCDAAALEPGEIDVIGIKKRAFMRVLDMEEQYLTVSERLIAELRRSIEAIGAQPRGGGGGA